MQRKGALKISRNFRNQPRAQAIPVLGTTKAFGFRLVWPNLAPDAVRPKSVGRSFECFREEHRLFRLC
jgi:hypothetical protein